MELKSRWTVPLSNEISQVSTKNKQEFYSLGKEEAVGT
jgi:hypothetical protein